MSAENAVIRYESAQSHRPFEALTDEGERRVFASEVAPWSRAPGAEPLVRPYGLATGGQITPTATDNQVSVAALTAYMAGVASANQDGLVAVSSGTVLATRGTELAPYRITSITVDDSGALAAVAGAAGEAFSEDRGADGGPPWIPVGSIEIGQVRLSSDAAAPVAAGEVYQVVGLHQERYDFPVWQVAYGHGQVTFAEALDPIHTGGEPKLVYAKYATPIFAAIPRSSDWTPAETTHSITSTPVYGGAVGGATASINQASFTAHLDDGISESFLAAKNERLWFEFRPDRNRSYPRQLTQGVLGISRSFPAAGGITASCTVTPDEPTIDQAEA